MGGSSSGRASASSRASAISSLFDSSSIAARGTALRTFADFDATGRVLPAGQLVCASDAPLPVSMSAMTKAARLDALGVMNMTSPGQSARTVCGLNSGVSRPHRQMRPSWGPPSRCAATAVKTTGVASSDDSLDGVSCSIA